MCSPRDTINLRSDGTLADDTSDSIAEDGLYRDISESRPSQGFSCQVDAMNRTSDRLTLTYRKQGWDLLF